MFPFDVLLVAFKQLHSDIYFSQFFIFVIRIFFPWKKFRVYQHTAPCIYFIQNFNARVRKKKKILDYKIWRGKGATSLSEQKHFPFSLLISFEITTHFLKEARWLFNWFFDKFIFTKKCAMKRQPDIITYKFIC